MARAPERRHHLLELGNGGPGHDVAVLVHRRGLYLRERLEQTASALDPQAGGFFDFEVAVAFAQRHVVIKDLHGAHASDEIYLETKGLINSTTGSLVPASAEFHVLSQH